jgi:predicted transposase/invertase (TIGR01784 family)
MPKKHSIHDSGYKKLFSNPIIVKEMMLSFVHEPWVKELDYNSLERIDKSFVTEEFIERESDIIYRINFNSEPIFIYLLIEFQSTVDRFISLRMLRYINSFYEYLISAKRIKKLPAVFPVMLYNGEKKWTAPEEFGNLVDKSIPEVYIPNFRYYKIAENEFSKETLSGIKNILSAVFYLENSAMKDVSNEIKNIVSLIEREKPQELRLFRKWIKHFFYGNDEISDKIETSIKEIEEVKDMLSTTLKKRDKIQFSHGVEFGIEQGIEKGIAKGIERGKREKAVETAIALLKDNMPVDKIADITGLSAEEIKELKA